MLTRRRTHTVCAKDSGIEIFADDKEKDETSGAKTGRIVLRFFRLAKGTKSTRFILEPFEAFDLWEKIAKVTQQGGRESLVHKFDAPGQGEVKTVLQVEKWQKGEREGCAFSLSRGGESINVSMLPSRFRHLGEFLKFLSTAQAWEDTITSGGNSK